MWSVYSVSLIVAGGCSLFSETEFSENGVLGTWVSQLGTNPCLCIRGHFIIDFAAHVLNCYYNFCVCFFFFLLPFLCVWNNLMFVLILLAKAKKKKKGRRVSMDILRHMSEIKSSVSFTFLYFPVMFQVFVFLARSTHPRICHILVLCFSWSLSVGDILECGNMEFCVVSWHCRDLEHLS